MLKVDLRGRGVVVVRESVLGEAQFKPDGFLTGRRQGGCQDEIWSDVREVRALVEVQRRFGGLAPRALLGGKLAIGPTDEILIQVMYGSPERSGHWPSELWNSPFKIGLPESFASAVLQVVVGLDDLSIPCGTLLIGRGGFDPIESAKLVFAQAAIVLAHVLEAMVNGSSAEESIMRAIELW